jgi:uroporphyrinogen decarboxylase
MRERLRREQNDSDIDFAEFFRHDIRYVSIPLPECPGGISLHEWVPLPTADDIAKCRKQTQILQERGLAVCGAYVCGVFEQLKHWFGDFETLTMPFSDPTRLARALDRVTEWKMGIYGAYAQAGVDIVWIGDDLGTQRSLIMSPDQYRQWYRPCHLRIVEHLRKIRSDVRIAFHCCGYVTPLIPDLIEIGIDVLEAVQAECMDIGLLKQEFGKDISFWGAVGAQSVLARTTPQQVMDGVRKTLSIMTPGGGYIAAPCHTLTEEVPWESIVAFHKAVQHYGAYPCPGTEK